LFISKFLQSNQRILTLLDDNYFILMYKIKNVETSNLLKNWYFVVNKIIGSLSLFDIEFRHVVVLCTLIYTCVWPCVSQSINIISALDVWGHWKRFYQSESRLDNGVISINLSRTFFTGIGHVLEYIDQVLKIHSF
jgi:hypothetical protein